MTVSPQSDPELSWRYAAAASTSCPLFIWDDLVMLGVHPQGQQPARLIALSLADGQIAWQKPLAYHYVHHLAAAFRDTTPILYTTLNSSDFLRDQATLKAWDKTGQELWQWQAPTVAQLFSRISLYKEQLWFTADSANLWYMNTTNDQEIRRYPLNINASWAAPLVISGMVIVPCKGPRLLALDKNGTGRWLYNASASTAHRLDRTPVRIGDDLIASFSRSLVVCLETNTGLERWQTAVGPVGKEISRPATDGQRVFVGTRAGLYALDVRTGQIVWHYATERGIIARPQVESGHVYLASHDHRIHIVAAATGKLLWQSDDLLARLEESLALDKRFILAINRRGELSALRPPPLTPDELLRRGLWHEAINQLSAEGETRRIAEVREVYDQPLPAAYAWEKLGEWERAAILYEVAGAWEYAAALWHMLEKTEPYAEALFNLAQSASSHMLGDEEMALHWEKAALALEQTGQKERTADCWRQVARYRHLPILKVAVVPERPLVKGQRTALVLYIRNEGYSRANFPTVRASGDHFANSKLMSTRQFKYLRDYDEVQETIFVHPVQSGDAVPLRFTVEYQDENQQIHVYRETIYVTIAEAESEEIGPTFHLNQHENQASTTGVLLHDTKGDLAEQSPLLLPPPASPMSTSEEVFQYYGLPAPAPEEKIITPLPLMAPVPAREEPLALRIDASAPTMVWLNQPFLLAVALRLPDSPRPNETELTQVHTGELIVSRPQEGQHIRLSLQVTSSGCQLHGPESRTIRYFAGQDSNVYRFQLLPTQTGPIRIAVSVFQEEDWLGDAYVNTIAETQSEQAGAKVEFTVTSQPIDSAVEIRVLQTEGASAFPVEMRLLDRSVYRESWLYLNRSELLKHQINAHQYGQSLGKMLFTGELERDYRQAVSVLEAEQTRLHVRLWLDEPALQDINWERLYHPWQTTWDRLGSNARTPFSRFVVAQSFTRPRPLAEYPVRVLAVLASPEDIEYFNLTPIPPAERQVYKNLWQEIDGLALTVLESGTEHPPTMNAIREAIIQGCHIIHFLCHGAIGKLGMTLYLEDENGQTDRVKAERLLGAVRAAAAPPLLINLTSCELGRTDGFLPLAPRLIAEGGAQAVLAMNGRIQVDTARQFTRHFYRRLLTHGLVDLATNEARALIHDQADWGVPVLFSRLTDNRLLSTPGNGNNSQFNQRLKP